MAEFDAAPEPAPVVAEPAPAPDAPADAADAAPPAVLLARTLLANGLEFSVHRCPRSLLRELAHVFPGQGLLPARGEAPAATACRAVPTCQHSAMDLVRWGDEVEKEKDHCLERFAAFGAAVCAELRAAGHWADYIDPCSGLPMLTKGQNSKVYDEVAGMQLLLRFATQNAGCCKVLLHPQWGAAVYPATLFTTAPFEQLQAVLSQYPVDPAGASVGA